MTTVAPAYLMTFFLSGAVFLLLALVAWHRRSANGAAACAVALFAQAVWALGYAGSMLSNRPPAQFIWGSLTMAGIMTVPVAYVLTAAYFARISRRFIYILRGAAAVQLLLFLLAVTDPLHHLFWGRNSLIGQSSTITGGPGFYGFVAIAYSCMILYELILLRFLMRVDGQRRGQALLLLLAPLPSVITTVLLFAGYEVIPGIDATPIGFLLTALVTWYACFVHGLFDPYNLIRSRIIEYMSDGVVVLDQNTRIVICNKIASRLMKPGRSPLQQKLSDCWRGGADEAYQLLHNKSEFREIRLSGQRPEVFDIQRIELSGLGNAPALLIVFRNSTERSAMEASLSEQATALTNANRELTELKEAAEIADNAKGEFIAHMSHELRSPLNGITGFSELITEVSHDARIRHYAKMIEETSSHLSQVFGDILDLSKLNGGGIQFRSEPTDPNELVINLLALYQWQMSQKGVHCSIACDPSPLPWVIVDPVRLRQIVLNLVGNAVKFTDRGSITIQMQWLAVEHARGSLSIRVVDTGAGIPEDQLTNIFLPFVSGPEHQGTGLGLAIANRLADAMGGRLEVESVMGHGSSFTLVLPQLTSVAPPAAREQHSPAQDESVVQQLHRSRQEIAQMAELTDNTTMELADWLLQLRDTGGRIRRRGFPLEIAGWAEQMQLDCEERGFNQYVPVLKQLIDAAKQFDVLQIQDAWKELGVL